MNDKTVFAKLREASTVVPAMVRKVAKFLVIAGPTVGACLLILAGFLLLGRHTHKDYIAGLAAAGLAIAIAKLFFAAYIMLVGYVYGDARRRGMPAALWTLLVVLIPNLIGFIVYFILRRSIFAPCPQCGRGAEIGQIYCSSCGHKLDLATASPQPGV